MGSEQTLYRGLCALSLIILSGCASLDELSEPMRRAADCVAASLRGMPDVTNVAVFPPRLLSNGGRSVVVSYGYPLSRRPVQFDLEDRDEGIWAVVVRDFDDIARRASMQCNIETVFIISGPIL